MDVAASFIAAECYCSAPLAEADYRHVYAVAHPDREIVTELIRSEAAKGRFYGQLLRTPVLCEKEYHKNKAEKTQYVTFRHKIKNIYNMYMNKHIIIQYQNVYHVLYVYNFV